MKLKEFQKFLYEEGIDVTLLTHPDVNITYFTQQKFSYALLEINPKDATLHLTSLDELPHLSGITVKKLHKGWEKKLGSKKVRRVGINKDVVSVAFWEKVHKLFPKAKL